VRLPGKHGQKGGQGHGAGPRGEAFAQIACSRREKKGVNLHQGGGKQEQEANQGRRRRSAYRGTGRKFPPNKRKPEEGGGNQRDNTGARIAHLI